MAIGSDNQTRVEYPCERCGGTNVARDAAARFDIDAQSWKLADLFDRGVCQDCNLDTAIASRTAYGEGQGWTRCDGEPPEGLKSYVLVVPRFEGETRQEADAAARRAGISVSGVDWHKVLEFRRACADRGDAGFGEPSAEVRVDAFLTANTCASPEGTVRVEDLHRAYIAWCEEAGERALLPMPFERALTRKGYTSILSAAGAHWQKLELIGKCEA